MMKISIVALVAALLVVSIALVANAQNNLSRLPRLSVRKQSFTVSGISSGAFMAQQFAVAFSKTVVGAGIVAGGPFYCSLGNEFVALDSCMKIPQMIDLSIIQDMIKEMESNGAIDHSSNVKNQKFYLFSGTEDFIVFQGVMRKLQQQLYSTFQVPISNIVTDFKTPAQHAFITNDYGNSCSMFGSPYINNCNLDQAKIILETVLSTKLNASQPLIDSNLYTFSQSGNYSATSFDDKGYIYIPTACKGRANCVVHLAFHGCNQGVQSVGDVFVKHAGYLKYAESNNIVVVFPQVKKSESFMVNPEGCFDWWGYSNTDFATKKGVQMRAIANMLIDLGVDVQ